MKLHRLAAVAATVLTLSGVLAAPASASTGYWTLVSVTCSNRVPWNGYVIQACTTVWNDGTNTKLYGDIGIHDNSSTTSVRGWATLDQNCGLGWTAVSTGNGLWNPNHGNAGDFYTPEGFYATGGACQYQTHGYITDNDVSVASDWSPTVAF